MTYAERRDAIYLPLREEGVFTWDWMYGEEYALASLYEIDGAFRREIAEATERLGRIFAKVVGVLQNSPAELLRELGVPEEAVGAVKRVVDPETVTLIGRFDFAPTQEGLKMLELNSDTPTGIVEAFYVNERVCAAYGKKDPNANLASGIGKGFRRFVELYQRLGYPVEQIYFSSLDWHEEDAGTTRYLLQQSGLKGQFIPLSDLRVYEDRLYALIDGEHWPVDLLYRLHALEKLAEETDVDGYPTGAHVLDLIARGKLAVLNPPSGFAAQTKAVQALIWNLYEEGEYFTDEERETIARYMLPTYLENRFHGKEPYVTKPIFGREGGAVTLHDASGQPIDRDVEDMYWEQPMVYQKLVDMQEIEVETLKGPYRGRLLWGSFLIDGQASAIIARVGGRITGNLSYYLPVALRDEA
jgi:glutathionylspermidine synthase